MSHMGQKPLEINHFESYIVTLIASANVDQGGTIRSLSAASGVSRARLDRILRSESSMTMMDFQSICNALGMLPWKVALAAEIGRTYDEVVADLEDAAAV